MLRRLVAPSLRAVLENVRAQEFLGELRALKKQHRVMSHPKFLGHYMKSTKTADSESAERACAALSTSGLILQHGPVVYLHPEEIARSVMQVLPHQAEVLRAELADVERELGALKTQRLQIERRVAWRRWAGQSLGLGLILLPWAVLFRLTYWDLSWDVVVSSRVRVGGDDQDPLGRVGAHGQNLSTWRPSAPSFLSTFV
ncbi:hypothetical protein QBZ16_000174 [Prototheca wickerhamii]|uniref:Calcium uniporter protein C-terminal domain-containing protein n=1 Tax=Prototheca wickerhamii TaxID=3111 RepID=A0AAD9IME3_PROWI|nr:hypothetical protein QBZ16_000174 [Prototheca wickerhamii]